MKDKPHIIPERKFVSFGLRIDVSLADRVDKARYNLAKGYEIGRSAFIRKAIEELLEKLGTTKGAKDE